jgi:maltose alpha-D-glucosyltransferase/alpha-amylase
MVTEEERDYLFAEYAKDPRMKRHMGIGRRLAPLLDRDRRLSELLYYLLFTLPGSPVLYYGDEIQMGDNLYLGDRDSVRTPMQWTPDRNGGFSRADFAQLYLPPLMDPVYGFSAVNVEAQQRNPSSFLHWMRRILAVRREFPVLGHRRARGHLVGQSVGPGLRPLVPDPSRRGPVNPVLCVHNLSRLAQPAELHVERWVGRQPIELLGRVAFPLIGTDPIRSPWRPTAPSASSWPERVA